MKTDISQIPKTMFHRLPWIALYSVAFYVVISVGTALFFRFMPANFFLNYTSAEAQNIYEHQPLPFKACRTMRFGSHRVEGSRIIYKLPETDGLTSQDRKNQAVIVGQFSFGGQLSPDRCVDLFINPSQYDHSKGYYYFRTIWNFEVGSNKKQIQYDSNVYIVNERALTPEEINQKILDLEQQIEMLKAQLAAVGVQPMTKPQQNPVAVIDTTEVTPPPREQETTSEPPDVEVPEQNGLVQGVIETVTGSVRYIVRNVISIL